MSGVQRRTSRKVLREGPVVERGRKVSRAGVEVGWEGGDTEEGQEGDLSLKEDCMKSCGPYPQRKTSLNGGGSRSGFRVFDPDEVSDHRRGWRCTVRGSYVDDSRVDRIPVVEDGPEDEKESRMRGDPSRTV